MTGPPDDVEHVRQRPRIALVPQPRQHRAQHLRVALRGDHLLQQRQGPVEVRLLPVLGEPELGDGVDPELPLPRVLAQAQPGQRVVRLLVAPLVQRVGHDPPGLGVLVDVAVGQGPRHEPLDRGVDARRVLQERRDGRVAALGLHLVALGAVGRASGHGDQLGAVLGVLAGHDVFPVVLLELVHQRALQVHAHPGTGDLQRGVAFAVVLLVVGPGLQQHLHHAQRASPGGQRERGVAVVVGDIHVGARLDQHPGDRGLSIGGGPEQRRPAAVLPAVDLGAGVEQRPGHLCAVPGGGRAQRQPALLALAGRVGIGAGGEQLADGLDLAVHRRAVELFLMHDRDPSLVRPRPGPSQGPVSWRGTHPAPAGVQ